MTTSGTVESRRALVVGAGIAGLSASIALARKGWAVEVVERNSENLTVGVGLNHPANALRALRGLGVYDEVAARGYTYVGIRRYDVHGALMAEFRPQNPDDVPFQISMTRADLHDILASAAADAGVQIRLGTSWRALNQTDGAVEVDFDDRSSGEYDLVVGADGIRSGLRTHLFGTDPDPVNTGYACWRVAVRRPPGMTMAEYWNGEEAKATVLLLNEETMYLLLVEKGDSSTPPPPKNAMASTLAERLRGFGGLIGEIRDQITDADEIHWAPLQQVFLPDPWFRGRVVLIGDAAHAVTPHLAQGAGMAMEDALALADELKGRPVADGLAAFMERRFTRVKYVQDQAHAILTNEMESDPAKKAAFAAQLGARQQRITDVLAAPA